ncbi:MAG: 3'-5' exonuclease [Campylobacter sp.]|nr:3'-5' exonuclease [Campylobacter sp.]
MSRNYICVFDCETIPDAPLLRKTFGFAGDNYEVSLRAFEHYLQTTKSSFLPIMFHKVVAISAVMADEYGKFLRVNTLEGENEREILTKFINFINKFNPRLVSFNGRGFDLPMIMVRAMRYNISANEYYDTDNRLLNKDKWCNYRSRYDGRFHLDLLDHIGDFGAVRGLKLDTLCASINLPGKYDVHGDQVLELFYADEIDKINEYCESDVLNTYWLFLKYELLRGKINIDDYASYLNVMSEFLLKERAELSYTPVFCEYIQDEFKRLKGELSYEVFLNYEDEIFDDSSDDESLIDDDLVEKIPLSQLQDELEKSGMALKKANEISTKEKPKYIEDEKLPEINLDENL